jgi:hypothetical protein
MRRLQLFALYLTLAASVLPGQAQQVDLNSLLDKVDQPHRWNNTPISQPVVNQQPARYPAANYQSTQMMGQPGYQQQGYGGNQPGYALQQRQAQAQQRPNLLSIFMGGSPQPAAQPKPPENPFSGGNLLKTFFGGSNGSGTPAQEASILGDAQSDLQTARDQAAQAEDASSRASSGDRGSRLSAASEAQYHANAAREAADRAYNRASGHSSGANDAASQARAEANRAQAAADRAHYNAEAGG